ncbi:site-specific integrase [Yinghuangia sp. YIM S09857]|uniref:site-specific integrase n=1 Tax=Yinghuangia sp. YIM S09857 TaxID=3436929 RepID=UPI003F52C49B
MTKKRDNGEGSIFPYRNSFAAYVWVTKPDGTRDRKWVYGKTRDIVHEKWVALHAQASKGVVPTSTPTVEAYLSYWLAEIVKPDRAPLTYIAYDCSSRLYITPHIGKKKINRLTVRDVRTWLNTLRATCQCCAQGKDAKRPEEHRNPQRRRRCCAIGQCCQQYPSQRTIQAARDALRAALTHAIAEELISKNVAGLVPVSKPRKRKFRPWTVDDAKGFLEHARNGRDSLYAAWILVLVLGLRRGEVLGLTWDLVDLDAGELTPERQLQRAGGELLHRETKTESSEATLPLPDICVTALKLRREEQQRAKERAGELWQDARGLVFTTRYGTPIEPSNLTRMFPARCVKAGVRPIKLHDTRHTCGSLLVALGVHPRVIMEILRHSQISVTMEVYSHVPSEDTRAALKKLGDQLT